MGSVLQLDWPSAAHVCVQRELGFKPTLEHATHDSRVSDQGRICDSTYIEFKWRVGVHFEQLKNALNKSCSELNFLQKTQQTLVSISLQSGARGHLKINIFEIF